jgi:putative OmpL-like beta-barrel porin-2
MADEVHAKAWYEEVTLNGFLASTWSYNFNRPDSRINALRVFDTADNTFAVDVFELVAQEAAIRPGDAGFRADVVAGSSVPRMSAAAGLFRDASGKAQDIDLQQAYATWVAPLGAGLRLDLGKFVTSHGYEVIEGYDGWNDNATRSFLFGYAIPFTHTGVRAGYACSPRLSATLMVVNGWDNALDNNRSKSVGGALALTPVAPLAVIVSGMWGPERDGNEADARSLLDAVVTWRSERRWNLGANADIGRERHAAPAGGDAMWSGVAGYARLAWTRRCAVSLRGESFDDRDGVRTGTAQTLSEFTLTPETTLSPHLIVRADLRLDRSSRRVFENGNGMHDTQSTALLDVLWHF